MPLLINEGLYLIQVLKPIRCLCLFYAKGQRSSIVDGISEVFPSLSCTCIGWAEQCLLPLGLEIHLAANKGVVSVAVCTVVGTS